jgi:carbonic anhydrase/acetyltransferase-like protein (isoleucine patch superfamily)
VAPRPRIAESAFVHPSAVVIGNVAIGPASSIWPTAVLRGDVEAIEIGEGCTIQDGAVVHTDEGMPTRIGNRVSVGHRAIVHGTVIDDDCMIAMGAVLLSGCHVGSGSIVGAGALCREGMQIPPNSLVVGVPGRIVRQTTEQDRDRIRYTSDYYVRLRERYQQGDL